MDQFEKDPEELQREIERASRLASAVSDQTTYQRLRQFVEELKQICSAAWLRAGQKKRSGRAQENFGKPVAARRTGIWNSG